jgi:hypothetical protein
MTNKGTSNRNGNGNGNRNGNGNGNSNRNGNGNGKNNRRSLRDLWLGDCSSTMKILEEYVGDGCDAAL